MKNPSLGRRFLLMLIVGLLLAGCAQIPFLSKREGGPTLEKGTTAKRPPTPEELARGQEVLRAGLESVTAAVSQLETEFAKTRSQIDELTKKLDQLATDFTRAKTGTEAEIKKVREELGARLAEVRAGVQTLLERSKQLETDIDQLKAAEATITGEIEKLKVKGTPRRRR